MGIRINELIDDGQCYETVRKMRWAAGVKCPYCQSEQIKGNGHSTRNHDCQKYKCKECGKIFDDLTGTVFSGHHQPLKAWILCAYFMGLNLSNDQIAAELGICQTDVFEMTTQLRMSIEEHSPKVQLSGTVEFDEVYIVAGHKGNPDAVKKRGEKDGGTDSKGPEGVEL